MKNFFNHKKHKIIINKVVSKFKWMSAVLQKKIRLIIMNKWRLVKNIQNINLKTIVNNVLLVVLIT